MTTEYEVREYNRLRQVIIYLLKNDFDLDDIVGFIKKDWNNKASRDVMTWGGNSASKYYYVSIGHEKIWEGMIP